MTHFWDEECVVYFLNLKFWLTSIAHNFTHSSLNCFIKKWRIIACLYTQKVVTIDLMCTHIHILSKWQQSNWIFKEKYLLLMNHFWSLEALIILSTVNRRQFIVGLHLCVKVLKKWRRTLRQWLAIGCTKSGKSAGR